MLETNSILYTRGIATIITGGDCITPHFSGKNHYILRALFCFAAVWRKKSRWLHKIAKWKILPPSWIGKVKQSSVILALFSILYLSWSRPVLPSSCVDFVISCSAPCFVILCIFSCWLDQWLFPGVSCLPITLCVIKPQCLLCICRVLSFLDVMFGELILFDLLLFTLLIKFSAFKSSSAFFFEFPVCYSTIIILNNIPN